MSNTIKIKRGTNLSNAGTPAAGELIYKSDTNELYVGNGSTAATGLTPIGGSATSGSNNQVLTDDGSGGINSESGLTFDGTKLNVSGIGDFEGSSSSGVNLYLGQTTSGTAFMYEFSTHDEAGGIINAGDHLQIKGYRWAQDISFARSGEGGSVPTARFHNNGSNGYLELYKVLNPTTDATYQANVKLNVNGDSFFRGGSVTIGDVSPLTTGGTPRLSLRGAGLNIGASASDMSYIRRIDTGDYQWQTWNGSNDGQIHLQPYGGNVGVGATNPLRKLHVVGSMAVNEGTDQYYGILMGGGENNDPKITIGDWHNSSGSIMWDSSANVLQIDSQHSTANSDIVFTGNDFATEYMRIKGTGKVGIGSAAPAAILHVENSDGSNLARFKDSDSSYAGIIIAGDTNGGHVGNSGGYAGEGIYFQDSIEVMRFYAAGSEQMRLTGTGRLGIGTTSPGQKLHIYDDSSSAQIHLQTTADANAQVRHQNDNISVYTGVSSADQYVWYHSSLSANAGFIPTSGMLYWNKSILLNVNNTAFSGRETGGTSRSMLKMNSANQIEVGNSNNVLKVPASSSIFSGTSSFNSTLNANSNIYLADNMTLYVGTDTTNGLRIFHLDSNNNNYIRSNGGALSIYTQTAQPLYFNTNNTNRLTISSGGDATFTGAVKLQSELDFTGNGNKIIDVETLEGSNSFRIRHHNPVGNVFHDGLKLEGNGGASLYYNNGLRFKTTSGGGTLYNDWNVTGALSFGSISGAISTSGNINTNGVYQMDGTTIIDSSKIPINIPDPHGTNRAGSVLVTDYAGVTSPTTSGWYTIASAAAANARGGGIIGLSFTGGYFTPATFTCDFQVDWSGNLLRCNVNNQTNNITKVRIIETGSTTELQAYFVISSSQGENTQSMRVSFTRDKYNPNWSIENPLTQESSPSVTGEEINGTSMTGRGMKFYSASTDVFEINNSHFVFNELSKDVNFRVESNGDANMLFVDGGNNRVGIGTGSPDSELHVSNNVGNLKVESTGSNNPSYIHIKNTTNQYDIFNNLGNLQIDVNGVATRFKIHSDGLVRSNSNHVFGIENTNSKAYIRANNGYSSASTPDYTWWYNDTCGIFHPAANTIGFSTGSNERFRLSDDGDFKFTGTGSNFESVLSGGVTYLLLSGTATQRIEFRNTSNNANGWIGIPSWNTDAWHEYMPTSSGNELAYIYESSRHNYYRGFTVNNGGDDYDFIVKGNSDDNLIKTDAGNDRVGIGETSPDTKLHIKQSGSGSYTTLKLEDSDRLMYLGRDAITVRDLSDNAAQLYINSNTTFSGSIVTGANITIGGLLSVTSSITTGYGVAFNNGNTNFLQYNNSGENVLYLRDTTNSQMLLTYGTSRTTIHKNTRHGDQVEFEDTNAVINRVSGDLEIRTYGGYDINLMPANYVGIGTTSGAAKLHVQEASTGHGSGGIITETAGADGNAGIRFRTNGSDRWAITTIGTNAATLRIRDINNSADRINITSAGALHVTNDVVAFSTTPSDKKLKTNVKDINYGLDTVMKLKPKQYDWKKDDRHDIGFIAQEVEEVIPEVVKDTEWFDNKIKTMDYEKLTAVLIKAVQEQQQQINELKEKLNG